jgi:CubicO group peptidase (beta-lactamase class C family)
MKVTGGLAEAALAICLLLVALVGAGGAALWFNSRRPVHSDAAAVPSSAAAASTGRYADAVEESRRLARGLVVAGNLPGLSVAAAVDGEIVWAEGFGWADVEAGTAVTPRTRFRLGALSKPLTAFGAALLYERGRLDLDAPVQRFVDNDDPEEQAAAERDEGGVRRALVRVSWLPRRSPVSASRMRDPG